MAALFMMCGPISGLTRSVSDGCQGGELSRYAAASHSNSAATQITQYDIPGERAVQAALRTILAGRTALIIAHRLSTVAIADRVLVIDAGRIIEDGPPEQLLAGQGRFAALHASWLETLA